MPRALTARPSVVIASVAVQSLSHVLVFAAPWTAAFHTSLSLPGHQRQACNSGVGYSLTGCPLSLSSLGTLLLVLAVPHAPLICSLQISPQIYQSLHFNELSSTQNPAFKTQKVLDQQSWLTLLVTQRIQKDLGPYRETAPEHPASPPTTTASSPSSASLSASGSRLLASGLAPS